MGHYILRLLMETGPPFYVVIRATRSSSRHQGKGRTFISQLFLRPWVLVRPRESNPRPPALQSSALPTELILPRGANGAEKVVSQLELAAWHESWSDFIRFRGFCIRALRSPGAPDSFSAIPGFRVGNVSREKLRAAGVGVERLTWTWACRQETKYPATSMKIQMRLTVIDFCSVSRAKHMPVGSHNHGGQSG